MPVTTRNGGSSHTDEDDLLASTDGEDETEKSEKSASTSASPSKIVQSTPSANSAKSKSEDEIMVPVLQVQKMIQEQMNLLLQNAFAQKLLAPNPVSPQISDEQKQWAKWDRDYTTPNFVIRPWLEAEKLVGPKNFKKWKNTITLDLRALNLVPFIESEKAAEISLSPVKQNTLDAQALQVLRAAVVTTIQNRLQKINSAFSAMKLLTEWFDGLEAHYLVKLHNRFHNLRFRPGYEEIRFVSDFENFIEEYGLHGTTFGDKYIVTLFLQKIDGIYDSDTPYYTYYNMICQDENQSFQHVKEKFLAVDNTKYKGALKRKHDNKENILHSHVNKKSTNSQKPSTQSGSSGSSTSSTGAKSLKEKYTVEQLKLLKTMSKEDKQKIKCSKCGEYFHDASKCKNSGRMCYKGFEYGHEKKDCPNSKTT